MKVAVGLDEMLIIHFYERTDKMRLIYARLVLDGEMQAWVDAIGSLEAW
ncbi:MAG: hypothetical protein IJP29_06435 [Lachnospiraceae bacterium]|nr:hypothetical protein [Lachnospiraceae bacterium]